MLREILKSLAHLWTAPDSEALFTAALTRRAFLLEQGLPEEREHEPLEWLGDRALNATVAQELWRRFPFAEPGRLDLLRRNLISAPTLAEIGRSVQILDEVRMGIGERQEGQVTSDAALSDHVEAVIGAALLAGGWPGAEALVKRLYEGRWPETLPESTRIEDSADVLDPMSELNLRVQQLWRRSLLKDDWTSWSEGPDHAKTWTASVTLPDGHLVMGQPVIGRLKDAKAEAARRALAYLQRLG